MCGITGYWSPRGKSLQEGILRRMNEALRRRGPDGEGRFEAPGIGLAMRRLSIIDLNGGWQPIYNEDRSVVVVMNGEIYNYKALTEKLKAAGHTFSTNSDTEVIVHLYEEYGLDFLKHLEGMFAIALWDKNRKRLVLARDRLGIKPLYFSFDNGLCLFGSEIKALLASGQINKGIDVEALDDLFAYNFIPAPRTIYNSIRKLSPGHMLLAEGEEYSIGAWWSLPNEAPRKLDLNDYAVEIVEDVLWKAVESHLVADVPVGAFLSGGIDSGIITAFAAKITEKPISTFTMGFASSGRAFLDERSYAREIANEYGCDHHEFEVSPDLQDIFPEIIRAFDEPFADDSVIPSYYVSKLASEKLKVALTGLGGDELFGGYRRHAGIRLDERLGWIGAVARTALALPARAVPESWARSDAIDHLKRFTSGGGSRAERYAGFMTALPNVRRHALYSEAVRKHLSETSFNPIKTHFENMPSGSALRRALRADLAVYLPDDVLTLTDRLSMWHSLELRVPFLDRSVVEVAAEVPDHALISGKEQKYILRRIAERWLPPSILSHRKQGFEAPMGAWLRGPLLPFFDAHVNEVTVKESGLLDWTSVKALRDAHIAGRAKHSKTLFAALMLLGWHAEYR